MASIERAGTRIDARREMVEQQLKPRGISDSRVLAAMLAVPRHAFVRAQSDRFAYEDRALGIGAGQTISQPYMVARACELAELAPGDRALEIGAGSGYQAAVMAQLCARVVAVELLPDLATRAAQTLHELAIGNVRVVCGDGTRGCPEEAPYSAIIVAAGGPDVPAALLDQLAPGGRLVMPIGPCELQELTVLRKDAAGAIAREPHDACRYVPLRGAGGWADREL
jgi:protein-L-isoaspartate(D-aspartate) O-methyltransferase